MEIVEIMKFLSHTKQVKQGCTLLLLLSMVSTNPLNILSPVSQSKLIFSNFFLSLEKVLIISTIIVL